MGDSVKLPSMDEPVHIFDIFSGSAALKKAIRKKHTGWVVREDGARFHFMKGVLGRDDGQPSVIYPNGTKEWLLDGEYHRKGGAAIEYANHAFERFLYGMRHAPDGELASAYSGQFEYWQFDEWHRSEGKPAIVWIDGTGEVWEKGKKVRDVTPGPTVPLNLIEPGIK
jgi:hypothetical protein